MKTFIPHTALQEVVLNISTVEAHLPIGTRSAVSPYPPTPYQSLIFYCRNPISMNKNREVEFTQQPLSVLLGPQVSRVNIKVHNRLKAIRVDFLPGAMFRILKVPMYELLDEGFNAGDLFGSKMKILTEQLSEITALEVGKRLVENFLLERLHSINKQQPFDKALRALYINDGNLSITKTASLSCLSIKQFERKCKERIGMNPKSYARILKFSKAYRLHEAFPEMDWISIAYKSGYYDQMHLIKDFKIFAGANPSEIEKQLRNTAIKMQKDLNF